jgi:hypothetical protein
MKTLVSFNETSFLHLETPYTVHFNQLIFCTTLKPTKITHNIHSSIVFNHSNMFRHYSAVLMEFLHHWSKRYVSSWFNMYYQTRR